MPVNTRRRTRSNSTAPAPTSPIAELPASKRHKKAAATEKKPAAKSPKVQAKELSPSRSRSASPKRGAASASPAKTQLKTPSRSPAAVPAKLKSGFDKVVGEIPRFSTDALLGPRERYAGKIAKKQDPVKAKQRQLINTEFLRLAAIDVEALKKESPTARHPYVHPTRILAQVRAEEEKRAKQLKAGANKVVAELQALGSDGIQSLFQQSAKKNSRIVHANTKAARIAADAKQVHKRTLDELKMLVSPTSQYRPSSVKGKIGVVATKDRVQTEAMKAATLREIRRLGTEIVDEALTDIKSLFKQ